MIWVGLRADRGDEDERPQSHSFWVLALTGLATSIDALAVGVGLAFVDVHIGWVAAAIGMATFVMVTVGVMEESAEQIESAIAALQAQRAVLGDAVVAMLPNDHPGDTLPLAGQPELGKVVVQAVWLFANVFEKDDRAAEIDLPGGAERGQQ